MAIKKLKEREAQWRKSQLLAAARTIFTRKGYHRTTMDDVAKEAGISKGALYLYFSGKEKMFMALIEKGLKDRTALVKEVLEQKIDCVEKIKAYINRSFEYFESNRDLWTMVMMLERDALCTDLHRSFHERTIKEMEQLLEYLSAIMKQGVNEGILKNEPPDILALGLGGMVQMFMLRAMFAKVRRSQEKEKKFIFDAFLEGVKL